MSTMWGMAANKVASKVMPKCKKCGDMMKGGKCAGCKKDEKNCDCKNEQDDHDEEE